MRKMDLDLPQLGQGTEIDVSAQFGLVVGSPFPPGGLESKRCCFQACLQRRIQIQASYRPDLASLVAKQGQMLFLHHRARQIFLSEYPLALPAQADIPYYPLIHPKGYLGSGRDYLKHHHRLWSSRELEHPAVFTCSPEGVFGHWSTALLTPSLSESS